MMEFQHQRHKIPTSLRRERELVVACMAMRSNVNLSRIVRTASCIGVAQFIACGNPKIDPRIARDGATEVTVDFRRSLPPVLKSFKSKGFMIVGLEQATDSQCLYDFSFVRRSVLVIGNERIGLNEDMLQLLDNVIEIPVYGLPHSFNVATAMALYEYCRQFPEG